MHVLKLVGFVLVVVAMGPFWVVGFVLAALHRIVNGLSLVVIRWAFWEPCQWGWFGLVRSWRSLKAAEPEVQRVAAAERFRRRVSRVGRGR